MPAAVLLVPVALPVLFRLWRGKGSASQVELAAEMARLLANAVLYGPKPPPTGRRGRPRVKGARLGSCAQIAQDAHWQDAVINVYGHDTAVQITAAAGLWYGSFEDAPGRIVLIRDPDSARACDLGLLTLDTASDPAAIAERYSWRWPIEPSNAAGKQVLGVGDACNRAEKAVERTVPFGFLVQSLLIVWYTRSGYHATDVTTRRLLCPWYQTKTCPSTADMLARLRREFPKARFSAIKPAHGHPGQIDDYFWTCDITAA